MSEPPTMYHGTRAGYRGRGGLVLPRSKHGGKGTNAPLKPGRTERADSADWVYLTSNKTLAWVYAWHAPGRGRPKVLTVMPLSEVFADPEHSEDMEAFRCEAAHVLAVDLDPEIDEYEAAAGWVDAAPTREA